MAGGLREFTAEELLQNRGVDGSPVYIAVRGQVYDVSAGRDFYGPGKVAVHTPCFLPSSWNKSGQVRTTCSSTSVGGPYEVFAGRECSRALAMMKIEEAECKDDMSDLTDKQITTLQDWVR
jgi:membrane-associated progesterone receptor component